jgi:transposase
VLDAVETGASRREAAERFEVSASSAVKWMQRWHETGSVAAKPTGGSISPLEKHADCKRSADQCHTSDRKTFDLIPLRD